MPLLSTTRLAARPIKLAALALIACTSLLGGCAADEPFAPEPDVTIIVSNHLVFDVTMHQEVFTTYGTVYTARGPLSSGAEASFQVPAYTADLESRLTVEIAASLDVGGDGAPTGVFHDRTVQRVGAFIFGLTAPLNDSPRPVLLDVTAGDRYVTPRIASAVADTISISFAGDGVELCVGYQWGETESGHRWDYQDRVLITEVRAYRGVGCQGAYHAWSLAAQSIAPGSGNVELRLEELPAASSVARAFDPGREDRRPSTPRSP